MRVDAEEGPVSPQPDTSTVPIGWLSRPMPRPERFPMTPDPLPPPRPRPPLAACGGPHGSCSAGPEWRRPATPAGRWTSGHSGRGPRPWCQGSESGVPWVRAGPRGDHDVGRRIRGVGVTAAEGPESDAMRLPSAPVTFLPTWVAMLLTRGAVRSRCPVRAPAIHPPEAARGRSGSFSDDGFCIICTGSLGTAMNGE